MRWSCELTPATALTEITLEQVQAFCVSSGADRRHGPGKVTRGDGQAGAEVHAEQAKPAAVD
jgi:hypothetical protein